MENFPELNGTEVALIRADSLTGHVLDENFDLALKDSQVVFSVFNDAAVALSFAQSIISQHRAIECVIYGKNKEVIHYITATNIM